MIGCARCAPRGLMHARTVCDEPGRARVDERLRDAKAACDHDHQVELDSIARLLCMCPVKGQCQGPGDSSHA